MPARLRPLPRLSRREREFMEILYRLGQGSVAQVREALAEPSSYSAVRAGLRLLEEKGHLSHEEIGGAYVYRPCVPREAARVPMLQHVLHAFFANSAEEMVATLLSARELKLSDAELNGLAEMIEQARRARKP